MAAGPTQRQISDARRKLVRRLGSEVSQRIGRPFEYKDGVAHVGDIIVSARLLRASNGEAALLPVASSPKGTLEGFHVTAETIVDSLIGE